MSSKNNDFIVKELYPLVEKALSTGLSKYKKVLSSFIEKRSKDLFDTVPCSRIYYTDDDRNELLNMLGITTKTVQDIIDKTYYGKIANFNPRAAKDPVTVVSLMIVRYFYLKKMPKELELACAYMAFSGKLYPSLHYRSWNIEPARYVMEWVVNNKLTQKFDIVSKGSIFGAVKSICETWVDSYGDRLRDCDDEDVVYLIQQLHNRIGSFMKNIAEAYYESYKNKDEFIVYDSDNLSDNNYHLADNDSFRAERIIEKTMEKINSSRADYKICKMCSDENIKTDEIKSIIESIMMDNKNLAEVKELITLLVVTYFEQSKTKDIRDIDFITFSIAPKPNTKDKNIIRMKEIVEGWLINNSNTYMRRKSRIATRNSYNKAIILYYTLIIHTANK